MRCWETEEWGAREMLVAHLEPRGVDKPEQEV